MNTGEAAAIVNAMDPSEGRFEITIIFRSINNVPKIADILNRINNLDKLKMFLGNMGSDLAEAVFDHMNEDKRNALRHTELPF